MLILAIEVLSACATQAVPPTTPKVKTLTMQDLFAHVPFKPTDLVPMTDYAARLNLSGVSLLPPRGRFEPWHMARWQRQEAEGVAFFSS